MPNFFDRRRKKLENMARIRQELIRKEPPDTTKIKDVELMECPSCHTPVRSDILDDNQYVCPKCSFHLRIGAYQRIRYVADRDTFHERLRTILPANPIAFPGYPEKLKAEQEKSGLTEAFVAGYCRINGIRTAIGVLDPNFMMGSMGTAVGEKVTRLIESADKHRLPLIMFIASGGARMQEGLFSLMQMAKTSAAIKRFSDHGGLYIAVLTHPTTGGVSASFASLADIIIAEPGALIGFAGPRVIEQTIGEKLPKGFQRAEFQREHGFVDKVMIRTRLREKLANLLALHQPYREEEDNG